MILCDSNVLIALVDSRDPLQQRASGDMEKLAGKGLLVTEPVLSETVYLLPLASHRLRLAELLGDFKIGPAPSLSPEIFFSQMFDWIAKYADHTPDWADAHLAVLSQHYPHFRVWSYDNEFKSIWRRPDGSRIPLAGKASS